MRVLLIDSNFLIQNNASGQISRVFWNYNCTRFNPTVICTKQNQSISSRCNVIDVPESIFVHKVFGLLREIGLSDLCHIPDVKRFSWKPAVMRKIKQIISSGHYDYIHSISCPETAHLIALEIKKMTGLPWIAQFNDPWVENVNKDFRSPRFHIIDAKLEEQVAKNADVIIHSNKVIFENWVERYGHELMNKATILPFSFNIPVLPSIQIKNHNARPLKIYHIGNMYASRSAKSFFDAVKVIEEKEKSCPLFDISFIGSLPHSEIEYAKRLGLRSNVSFKGTLPPEQLESYYNEADMFLVIDMNIGRSASWPSKLMLYHYYRKPILSITTKGSIIEDDMIASGHRSFYFDDIQGISNYLSMASNNYDAITHFNHNYWKQFTVENVSGMYLNIVERFFSKHQ